jgi:HNH endonuclease
VDYNEYIQSEGWDAKRKRRLKKDGYTCQRCGAKNKPLDVHHLNYDRLGKERMGDLESLCRHCHDKEHGDKKLLLGICQTCGEFMAILRQWLADGWTRWTCEDGHVNEKRGWK